MKVIQLDQVTSTNDEARLRIERGEIEDVACIVAREQTLGRGTHGRQWSSIRDAGVYLSLARVFERGVARPTMHFTLAAGVACAEVIEELLHLPIALKPVNDLCVAGGKLGGILAETSVAGTDIDWLIIGVGINVRTVNRPVETDALPAVSLEEALPADRMPAALAPELAEVIAARVNAWCDVALSGDDERIRSAYERRLLAGYEWPGTTSA